MSQRHQRSYEFDDLPLSGVAPGTNLLVSGPTMAGTRDLALKFVCDGNGREEGSIVISTDTGGRKVLRTCESFVDDLDLSQIGVVDCVSNQRDQSRFDQAVRPISSPGDLTGISIEFSSLYQALAREDITRVRTVLYSVSTLTMYTEFPTVCRFVHSLTGRVASSDGLGVFVVDPTTQDERTVNTIAQLCDGRIEVRETDDGQQQLRVRGLPDQPREWTPFSL